MIKFRIFGLGKPGAPPAAGSQQDDATHTGVAGGVPDHPNGKRVLIVDDDPVFLRATTMKLNAAGFQVAIAKDGSEAITALAESTPDAVLMDINFPADACNGGMGSWDGFQIMYWLRGLPGARGARFIMISNSDTPEYRKRAHELGAIAYLQKPVQDEALLASINRQN
jgi:CheY-like chemotaxis protein